MEVLDIVLLELGLEVANPGIHGDIARVEQYVKNYCHIPEIPPELNFTMADMVLDLQKGRGGENVVITNADMGDTGYGFTFDQAMYNLLHDYETALRSYRKVRW